MDSQEIGTGRLYDDLEFLMPLISPPEEYAEEASHWRTLLREKLGAGRHELLELGVGGGHNLSHLTGEFDATAVDISEAMLAWCARLNPGVKLERGDMRTIRLGRRFAAVLIHDAISYMLTEADLAAVFETAASHLDVGGVLIVSPDRFVETFSAPAIEHAVHEAGGRRLTYVEFTRHPDPDKTILETIMVYLIESQGKLSIEHDRHLTGIFPRATWLCLMREAGFSVERRSFRLAAPPQPYELLIGTRV